MKWFVWVKLIEGNYKESLVFVKCDVKIVRDEIEVGYGGFWLLYERNLDIVLWVVRGVVV